MKLSSVKLYALFEAWLNGNRSAVTAQLKTPLHAAQFCAILHDICKKETLPYHLEGLINLLEIDEEQDEHTKTIEFVGRAL